MSETQGWGLFGIHMETWEVQGGQVRTEKSGKWIEGVALTGSNMRIECIFEESCVVPWRWEWKLLAVFRKGEETRKGRALPKQDKAEQNSAAVFQLDKKKGGVGK